MNDERRTRQNRTTLQDSITAMLQGYDVPLRWLEGAFPRLIKLRNDIVHRGMARKSFQPQIQHHVDVVRELLTRIFLSFSDTRVVTIAIGSEHAIS